MNALEANFSIAEFSEGMQQSKDFSERWDSLVKHLGAYGADQINYGVLDNISFKMAEAPVTFISTMDPEWIGYYGESRFDLHDPHVNFVRQGRLAPYRWSEEILPRIDDDLARDVVVQTVDAGLRSQINMIAPDPLGISSPIGGMTIGSSLRSREFFGCVGGGDLMLVTAASIFHHHSIGEMRRQQVGARPLSTRERDCMSYIALGLRITGIADKMGLNAVTVEMHLRNARKKLRAKTTPQAIARAMMFGDIAL
ncbi:helix-turn-helix transcriptional regulator [Sphingosinicella rhizophila]|uniref:LuxR C-terminal-related transcriptional regulator n=1 Tax=Sphingosinicella rhizophila TaxID=3050082 RepID=A0ABU3QAT4_9SPHN|nr:LuxR C-terminal-related transcriptional regulator [Sphingosinicella sp. GR2756]MDT9600244.1 LuxR C-terminal-related transcriptional regulator [Sphingosinicella sp. GR2756]